jgi:predicted dehydrogenase
MGQLHAAKLAERDDVELTIVDPSAGRRGPAPRLPDFAIIATPTRCHAEVALPLLERGVPCLVEKPLSARAADGAALADFPHLCVGHIERFNPALAPLSGCRPRFVQAERIAPPTGRATDVDVIADLMIHDIDLALSFMPGAVTDVRAVGVGVVSGTADIVNARLEIRQSDGSTAVATLTASRVSRREARTLRLVEPGVYWTVDLSAGRVQRVPWGEGALGATEVTVPQGDALQAQHDAFLSAVRGQGDFVCSGQEALQAVAIADQIRAAVQAGS